MKQLVPYSKSVIAWMLIIPTLAWCYIGLFLTMILWYPAGLSIESWQDHLIHFSIIYVMWLLVFFSYRLFDWETLRAAQAFFGRLVAALFLCLIIAALYFYFQPSLLITPRRFLFAHLLFSGLGIISWYMLMRRAASRNRRREVYAYQVKGVDFNNEIEEIISRYQFTGLKFAGWLEVSQNLPVGSVVVMPARADIKPEDTRTLFALRNQGAQFAEFHELYENLTRSVHLSALSDLWFIHSIDYRSHQLFDLAKRFFDIISGIIAMIVFLVSFPFIALLIKLTSRGSVIFSQRRVGQNGRTFTLYKYRTMNSASANNTWTVPGDTRITFVGKILRALRLDELPQAWNILKGNMSVVGPRPEQENIVKNLEEQIPYYSERHAVKPGLTGWAQLHVYAGSLEETRQKLQYDLYYIKHRSMLFDLEIILKTFYNVVTYSGR